MSVNVALDHGRGPIVSAWGLGQDMAFFTPRSGGSKSITTLDRRYFPELRMLLHTWHSIFLDVQDASDYADSKSDFLASQCRRYRAELEVCLLHSVARLEEDNDNKMAVESKMHQENHEEASKEKIKSHLLLLQGALSTLHVVEIMFLDDADNVTSQLVDWHQRKTDLPRGMDAQPDSERYWSAVYILTIQGRIKEATELIAMNGGLVHRYQELTRVLIELMEDLPSLTTNYAHTAPINLSSAMQDWRGRLTALRDYVSNETNNVQPEIDILCRILSGDENTLINYAQNWEELLVALLLFSFPDKSKADLSSLTDFCVSRMQGQSSIKWSAMDACNTAVLKLELSEVLQVIDQVFDISWFSAHLIDLIYHAGYSFQPFLQENEDTEFKTQDISDSHTDSVSSHLREHWLLRYCETMMYRDDFWTVALSYLYHCPQRGAIYAQSLLNHREITGDSAYLAFKVIDACNRFGLVNLKRATQLRMGVLASQQKRYGNAVFWFSEAREVRHISALCLFLTNSYLKVATGESPLAQRTRQELLMAMESVIETAPNVELCGMLSFLAKFHLVIVSASELDEKVETMSPLEHVDLARRTLAAIVSVFASGCAPRPSWLFLLTQATAILSGGDDVVLKTGEVQLLLRMMGEVMSPMHTKLRAQSLSFVEGDLKQLQIVLASALSSSLERS